MKNRRKHSGVPPGYVKKDFDLIVKNKESRGKSSGTYEKTDTGWTSDDEIKFRKETEERFRNRTPPKNKEENIFARVTKEEMEVWSKSKLKKPLPDNEIWIFTFIIWYKLMAQRNCVHLKWLEYTLCGAKGDLPPVKTDLEEHVTCEICKKIFQSTESDL